MQLGVLVDLAMDVDDETFFFQGLQVCLEGREIFHGCPVNDQGECIANRPASRIRLSDCMV
jgi:hypothetical protein